jgi:hypothetical protein
MYKLSEEIDRLTYPDAVRFYDTYFGAGKWSHKVRFDKSKEHVLYNKIMLCLKRLLRNGVDVVILDAADVPVSTVVVEPVIKTAELPVEHLLKLDSLEVHEKKQIAAQLYREAGKMREVTFSSDAEERRKACLFIVRAMRRNRELWDEINYFELHGKWPVVESVSISDDIMQLSVGELIQRQKNIRPWLSKEKKKIDQESDETKKKLRQANYDAQRIVLDQIEARLNEL